MAKMSARRITRTVGKMEEEEEGFVPASALRVGRHCNVFIDTTVLAEFTRSDHACVRVERVGAGIIVDISDCPGRWEVREDPDRTKFQEVLRLIDARA